MKSMRETNKKGEGKIPFVIVGLIIAIVSFLIILFVYFQLNPSETTDDAVCHDSVVMRSGGFLTQQVFPINCKTDYVCLSRDNTCGAMTSSRDIIKVQTKEDVYKALAEEGANCWWMFGEGKLDYIGQGFESDLYCSLCSQVAFDDSLYNMFAINPNPVARADLGIPEDYSNSVINREEFYEYLAKTNVSGEDMNYLDYFLGLKNSQLISDALEANNSNFGYMDIKKQHFIMIGEFKKVGPFYQTVKDIGKGALAAFALPIPVIGGPIAIALLVSPYYNPFTKKAGYLLGTIVEGESGHIYLVPTIIEANSADYQNLHCESVNTLA